MKHHIPRTSDVLLCIFTAYLLVVPNFGINSFLTRLSVLLDCCSCPERIWSEEFCGGRAKEVIPDKKNLRHSSNKISAKLKVRGRVDEEQQSDKACDVGLPPTRIDKWSGGYWNPGLGMRWLKVLEKMMVEIFRVRHLQLFLLIVIAALGRNSYKLIPSSSLSLPSS